MDDVSPDRDARATADRISELGRSVRANPAHRVQLRDDLIRRHHQLQPETRSRGWIWSRLTPLKRRSVLLAPALLVAALGSVLAWVLPISGHQQPPTAEAQIVSRLAQTAPYVTAVQWTLRRELGGKTTLVRLGLQFGRNQRLYIYHHQPYLWQKDHWSLVPASDTIDSNRPFYWETAFASLPTRLSENHSTRLASQIIDGHTALGLRYSTHQSNGSTLTTTCWIDQSTSLLIRLQRLRTRGHIVVEREVADYGYMYQRIV